MTKHYSPDGEELRPYTIRQPSHPLLSMGPSGVEPHIDALASAGIYDDLTQEQQAIIIRLMQQAYRNGQAQQGAEKIDNDAVWVDRVGLLERQPDATTWLVTGYDAAKDAEMIRARDAELGTGYTITQYNEWAKSYYARQLGAIGGSSRSKRKAAASRANGRKGGRPRVAKGR